MPYLFNLAYLLLLLLVSPWLVVQSLRHGKYTQGWREKWLGRVPPRTGSNPCLWLHAVSVGEVNLLQSLLVRFEKQYAGWDVVISATTRAGYELARKKFSRHYVCYAPLDFTWSVAAALKRIQPRMLVLAELEIWPNLVRAAHRAGVKVCVVNGRLSASSFRGYRRVRPLLRPTFQQLDCVAAQNEEYAERFRQLGVPPQRVIVTGSLKFDNANTHRENALTRSLCELAGLLPQHQVFLAGSTQAPEEELALATYRELMQRFPRLRLILVPRHPERFEEVARLLAASGLPWRRRSELSSSPQTDGASILLVDSVGELGAWWGAAHVAFVGGSMGQRGGQNMIEPAAYGAAVSFGPNTRNFRDVVEQFLAVQGAVVVQDGRELTQFVERCLLQPEFAARLGENAQRLVEKNQGAADKTLDLLAPLLQNGSSYREREAA